MSKVVNKTDFLPWIGYAADNKVVNNRGRAIGTPVKLATKHMWPRKNWCDFALQCTRFIIAHSVGDLWHPTSSRGAEGLLYR